MNKVEFLALLDELGRVLSLLQDYLDRHQTCLEKSLTRNLPPSWGQSAGSPSFDHYKRRFDAVFARMAYHKTLRHFRRMDLDRLLADQDTIQKWEFYFKAKMNVDEYNRKYENDIQIMEAKVNAGIASYS